MVYATIAISLIFWAQDLIAKHGSIVWGKVVEGEIVFDGI